MSADASLAVLAPAYPVLSETFVRRDVEGLRARGLEVFALGLRAGESGVEGATADHVVYGAPGRWAALAREVLRHPIRTAATLGGALRDALAPGEATGLGGRAKLLVQALAGVGLAGWLRENEVDHLHCHFAHAPASVGMYAARQAGIPFSFVGHANDLFQRRQLLRRKLQRAAFVACISHWHQELYLGIEPTCGAKLRVVRCGVDVDAWDVVASRREPEECLRLVSVARLVEKKGIDTLVSALARLKSAGHEAIQLVVVGDGPLSEALAAQGVREGVDDRIEWRGAQPVDAVRTLLGDSDVFVLPCRVSGRGDMDGIPVALMEAMACRLAVVAGDLPAIRELVQDRATGLLVPGGDVEAVADGLARLLSEPALRERLGAAGRLRVMEEFSADANVRRLAAAVEEAGSAS